MVFQHPFFFENEHQTAISTQSQRSTVSVHMKQMIAGVIREPETGVESNYEVLFHDFRNSIGYYELDKKRKKLAAKSEKDAEISITLSQYRK